MSLDRHKKLGKKEERTPATADFYVHEYWPNSKRGFVHVEQLPEWDQRLIEVCWTVETEAGTMLVAHMWWDDKTQKHYIRRAVSMNTTEWLN